MDFKRNVDVLEMTYKDVYLSEFAKVLQTLPAEKLEYCAEIAAKNFSLENGNFDISESKVMTLIARTIAQNKNPESLININYSDAIRINRNALPDLYLPAKDAPQKSESDYPKSGVIDFSFKNIRSSEEICAHIYELIDNNNPGASNSMFCQSKNVRMEDMPMQGWKFHISASSLADYERLCEVAIPEFTKAGVAFKVVRPDKFQHQMDSAQIGKAITIYPTENFDIKIFSPKLRSMLLDSRGVDPVGDKNIAGRIYARYGRFMPSNTQSHHITDAYGNVSLDPKAHRKSEPDFLTKSSSEDILSFYSKSKEKYLLSNDFKTYLQEKKTMLECDGKNHCYICMEVKPMDYPKIQGILSDRNNSDGELNSKYTLSLLTKVDNKDCLMIHKSEFGDILSALSEKSINFNRCDWDIRNNYYIIPDKAFDNLSERFNGLYGVELYKTTGDVGILQCDTVFNKEILEICREENVPVVEWEVNSVDNLHYSVNSMYEQGICCSPLDVQIPEAQMR
jgi:hypothetical protein